MSCCYIAGITWPLLFYKHAYVALEIVFIWIWLRWFGFSLHSSVLSWWLGILQCESSQVRDKNQIFRFFCHECQRVFHDRLVNNQDKTYFNTIVCEMASKNAFTKTHIIMCHSPHFTVTILIPTLSFFSVFFSLMLFMSYPGKKMFFFFLFASHFGFFEFMSKYLPKNKMVLSYNMNCLVFVLYWIEYKSKKDLKVIAYLHFKQCPNFFKIGVVFCIFLSWGILLFLTLSVSFFKANILALTWTPRTFLLSPSYLVTSSR